jgi:hypothetical protein
MGRYRKKPVEIEARQFDGQKPSADAILAWMGSGKAWSGVLVIETLEGDMVASPGDWIIKGVKGEFYPCKPDIFAATYDEVSP